MASERCVVAPYESRSTPHRADGRLPRLAAFVHLDLGGTGQDVGQIAAFVEHLDDKTMQRYNPFTLKDKRETANSISFES